MDVNVNQMVRVKRSYHVQKRSNRKRSILRRVFSAKQLYECLQPLFFVTYWHGLTPFYICSTKRTEDGCGTRKENKKLKHSLFGYLNGIIHIVLYGSLYVMTLINSCESVVGYFFRPISHSVASITYFGDFMQILSGFIGVTVIYLTAIIPKHRLQHSLQTVQRLDARLCGVGIKIMYSKVLRFSYVYLLSIFVVNSVYAMGCFSMLKSLQVKPSLSLHFTFVLQHTVVSIAISMFACFSKMLEMRLIMMHKVLKNLSHQWDSQNQIKTINTQKQRSLQCLDSFSMYTIVTKDPSDIIQESMEIHQLICEAAHTANKYFTYQLLTIISIAFLIIVFDAYYVLETLLGKSKRESKFKTVEFVTFFSCQMILYVIAIISIVEGSNRAISKSEKTGGIVHSLLNKAKSPEVKEKLQQFSMQLLHLKINFTAAGLFNIDRTLYFTICGALTTYLIILLQFTSNAPSYNDTKFFPVGIGKDQLNTSQAVNVTMK